MSKKKKLTKREIKIRKQWKRVYDWQRYQESKQVELPYKINNINEFKAIYSASKNITQIKYYIKYKTNVKTAKAITRQVKKLNLDISEEDIKRYTTSELLKDNPKLAESIEEYREQLFEQDFSKSAVANAVSSYYFGS